MKFLKILLTWKNTVESPAHVVNKLKETIVVLILKLIIVLFIVRIFIIIFQELPTRNISWLYDIFTNTTLPTLPTLQL